MGGAGAGHVAAALVGVTQDVFVRVLEGKLRLSCTTSELPDALLIAMAQAG